MTYAGLNGDGHFGRLNLTSSLYYAFGEDSNSYATNSYARAGLMLHTLAAWLGEATMARVMFAYAARWRYRHPAAEDFYVVVNEISGQDMAWFFQQFARGTATLDYEIVGFDNRRPETAEARSVTVRRLGEAWYPHELRVTLNDETRVTIQPLAVNQTQIEYRLTNEKTGAQWNETWPHQERAHRFRVPGGSEIKLAQLDPDNRVLLEANQVNNSYLKTVAIASTARWASGLMFWLQAILQMAASFA